MAQKGNPMLTVRLTPQQHKAFDLLAEKEGSTKAELARHELLALLERRGFDSSTGERKQNG